MGLAICVDKETGLATADVLSPTQCGSAWGVMSAANRRWAARRARKGITKPVRGTLLLLVGARFALEAVHPRFVDRRLEFADDQQTILP